MDNILTQSGFNKLKAELERLRDTDRTVVAQRIKDARDMGNIEENPVYDAALEQQGFIEGRIIELEEILSNSKVLEENLRADIVSIGSTVVVEISGKKNIFTIVGVAEADPLKKKISHESPVGKALLGAKKGEEVNVKTPVISAKYKILEIK